MKRVQLSFQKSAAAKSAAAKPAIQHYNIPLKKLKNNKTL